MTTIVRFFVILSEAAAQTLKFGAAWVVARLAWPTDPERRREERLRTQGRCIAGFFRNLGATFIKIGQILSARPDLLPDHVIKELQTLQDRVPPFPFREVERTVEEDLTRPIDDIFESFEEAPIAAASVAQVHEAVLKSGERVAVKVQRPRIAATMERDLSIIKILSALLELVPGVNNIGPRKMAGEFAGAIHAQLDFPLEILNNRRFAKNLADFDFVRVPEIYDEYSGQRVITMEYIDGQKLTDVLDDPTLDGKKLAGQMIDLYMAMAFRDFFLHADLHPGNILVDSEYRFVLLDTGLVHETPPHYVRKFFRVYTAMMARDGNLALEAYLEDVEIGESQRRAALIDVDAMIEKYDDLAFSEFEVGRAILDIFAVLRKHRIYLDSELTGFFLSELTFEGIAKMLDSELDLINLVPQKLPAFVDQLDFIDADDPIIAAIYARRAEILGEIDLPSAKRPACSGQ